MARKASGVNKNNHPRRTTHRRKTIKPAGQYQTQLALISAATGVLTALITAAAQLLAAWIALGK